MIVIDTTRPEGAYVSHEDIEGTGVRLFRIERVNGNCTVDGIQVTRGEAETILIALLRELQKR
jgi:hypothetical protein